MTTGNFGVVEGLIMTLDVPSGAISHFESIGYHGHDLTSLQEKLKQRLIPVCAETATGEGAAPTDLKELPQGVTCALPFSVAPECLGVLGLGPKLIGEPYNDDDKELLATLVNSLFVALKNARSFEDIKRLNVSLQGKNKQLEQALEELQAALRKVEILESIKSNLCKFVPTTVTRLIEKSPTASIPEAAEQDVSVLFLDIEGYTRMSERLCGAELNEIVERYFSVFMDAIYENNGDVNETAGDGLMVLFHNEDRVTNALEAVRAALSIRAKANLVNKEGGATSEPLVVNMGINSGRALLGAAKFESYTGSRWTYTARGMVTNLAARIGALASEGAILLSSSTAERVKEHFPIKPLGAFSLKNVSEKVDVYTLEENETA